MECNCPGSRSEPAEERRDHRGELDRRLRGGRPGAGPARAILPRDHHRLQPEVSEHTVQHVPYIVSNLHISTW